MRESYHASIIAGFVIAAIMASYNSAPATFVERVIIFVISGAVFGGLISMFYGEIANAAYRRGYKQAQEDERNGSPRFRQSLGL